MKARHCAFNRGADSVSAIDSDSMNRRDLLKSCALVAIPAALSGTAIAAGGHARLRPALCAYSYRTDLASKKMTYLDLVRLAVETDIDGLDLTVYWFPDTSDAFLYPLKQLAYKNGVEIYSISIRTDMCKMPGDAAAKEFGEVKKWVDVAAKLGAGHIRVFGGTVPKGVAEDEAAKWVVELLKRSAEYAGSKGVILGLENHGGITEKASRIVDIVKQVNSPWVGVNLDTGNFKHDVYKQIEMIVPYAVNVQVKSDFVDETGTHESDWNRIAGMLQRASYRGYLALEYESVKSVDTEVPRLLQKLKEVSRKYSA